MVASSSRDVLSKARRLSSLLTDVKSEDDPEKLNTEIHNVFDIALSEYVDGFTRFMVSLCSRDKTCCFWFQYQTTNCLVYMASVASIRNWDWVLRMAAIKSMAAIFWAFDRLTYQRLIPQHAADILCYPKEILDQLHKGAFTVHKRSLPRGLVRNYRHAQLFIIDGLGHATWSSKMPVSRS